MAAIDYIIVTGSRRRGHRSNNQQRGQEDIRGDAVRQGGLTNGMEKSQRALWYRSYCAS